MYVKVIVCQECGKELQPCSSFCRNCDKKTSHTEYKTVFCWHWTEQLMLIALSLILAVFFAPWFSGDIINQSNPVSAYSIITKLTDLNVDFLDSYNIFRMLLFIPLFSSAIFISICFQEKLSNIPFTGPLLFIIISSGIFTLLSPLLSIPLSLAASLFISIIISLIHRQFIKKSHQTAGITYLEMIKIFLSLSQLLYLSELYSTFYDKIEKVSLIHTWGFWVASVMILIITSIILFRQTKTPHDLCRSTLFIIFSTAIFFSLTRPLFYSETSIFIANNIHEIAVELITHIQIVGTALIIAISAGVPIGVYIAKKPDLAEIVLYISSILITIPSIAMFGFMMPVLSSIDNKLSFVDGIGIGMVPAIAALSLYSLLPIIRNTYIALKSVDPSTIEAGVGMGMTSLQLLMKLQLPLAAPIIMAGVRTSVVMAIAIAAIAAYIGAGGLGTFISEGIQMSTNAAVIAGAMLMSILAIVMDLVLGKIETLLIPEGLKIKARL